MKRYLIPLVVALTVTQVQAQGETVLINFLPTVVRHMFDASDDDKLEDTPPVTIQSSGTGNTCEEALNNAKMHALEKVNGSWVRSTQRSNNGKYNEEIVRYSGGVIKSYKYLRNDCTFVIIEAEVQKRSNKVQLETANISRANIVHIQGIKEANDRKLEAIQRMDSRASAVYFKPISTDFQMINNREVAVAIKGTFAFNDKWKADYFELRQMIGYFNLPSFEPYARITIVAMDDGGDEIFRTTFTHEGEWELWGRKSYGAMPTMEVYPNKKEEGTVRFKIPYDKMVNVKSFRVDIL